MKTIILRFLAGLLGIVFGFIAYGYYSEPVGNAGRILGIISMLSGCIIVFHYVCTGSRKLFFPKFEPTKKKRK